MNDKVLSAIKKLELTESERKSRDAISILYKRKEEAYSILKCSCENTEKRVRPNGAVWLQCVDCGKLTQRLPKSEYRSHLPIAHIENREKQNGDDFKMVYTRFCISLHELKKDFREKMRAYKESAEWKKIADKRIKHDNEHCVVCHSANGIEAYHASYINAFQEQIDDLVTLCKTCRVAMVKVKKESGEWAGA